MVRVDTLSAPFYVLQGVHQGGVYSMLMYQLYNADLILELQSLKLGALVGGLDITCPVYADDTSIITTSTTSMNALLNLAYNHSLSGGMIADPDKCNVMTFGNNDHAVQPMFKIGDKQVTIVQNQTHVGIPLSTSGSVSEYVEKAVTSGKRKCFSLLGLGSTCGGLNPLTASCLYWTLSIPTMLYGSSIISYPNNDVELIQTAHRQIGKRIQCLPT
ncbi:unnamed protein product, partial [Owenia fusiformis]